MTQTDNRKRLSGLLFLMMLLLIAACSPQVVVVTATPDVTLLPTFTSSPLPSLTPTPGPTRFIATATEAPITAGPDSTATIQVATVEPLTGAQVPPPLSINLPDGWQYAYETLAVYDFDTYRALPFAVYRGPITGGTGFIILLWGFPNFFSGNPITGEGMEPNLWVDGLRLLNLAIIEPDCHEGTDVIHDYTIGGLPAVGTTFSATDCPSEPNTHGWFAGLQVENLNFIFYMYGYPIEAMDTGIPFQEMQAILDTIEFRIEDLQLIPTHTPLPE